MRQLIALTARVQDKSPLLMCGSCMQVSLPTRAVLFCSCSKEELGDAINAQGLSYAATHKGMSGSWRFEVAGTKWVLGLGSEKDRCRTAVDRQLQVGL